MCTQYRCAHLLSFVFMAIPFFTQKVVFLFHMGQSLSRRGGDLIPGLIPGSLYRGLCPDPHAEARSQIGSVSCDLVRYPLARALLWQLPLRDSGGLPGWIAWVFKP